MNLQERIDAAARAASVIDVHGHLGPWGTFAIHGGDVGAVLRTMDLCGIAMLIIAPHLAIGPGMVAGNRLALETAESHPGRLRCYCAVNPNRPRREIRGQLEELIATRRAVGIKLHPSLHRVSILADAYRPALEYAEGVGVPILVHTWEGDPHCAPALVGAASDRHPHARWVLAHSGGAHSGFDECVSVARERPNLWLDITGSRQPFGVLAGLVRELGPERLVFGSDLPFLDPRPKLGHVLFADITDEARQAILRDNASRLFGLGAA